MKGSKNESFAGIMAPVSGLALREHVEKKGIMAKAAR